ncbi:NTP pyrophosphatase (non-canonical NTP hydrolase) [Streptomyces puniciscabiei]|uniref:NTP pyrophosphatase (Non-canonical NTP hydrolase) n=1 Tax=Streptomyces puniciscabiei TaxID=164348 RepID=A0A542UKC1_9ACTN|nr:MazG-like family protein [Streptomyces puniciscabiei]TQK99521.1 NTP pyrophosphatase (non-canonical NTP hydrolase) [Streptomyces puniciscabiei]
MTDQDTTGPAASTGPTPATTADTTPALWPTIDELWSRLEATRRHAGQEGVLLRVLKLSEEVGEVAEAIIGTTGQNPRKGVTHTWEDVQAELCDVVITALVALRTLTPEAREVFEGHLRRVRDRPLEPSA